MADKSSDPKVLDAKDLKLASMEALPEVSRNLAKKFDPDNPSDYPLYAAAQG